MSYSNHINEKFFYSDANNPNVPQMNGNLEGFCNTCGCNDIKCLNCSDCSNCSNINQHKHKHKHKHQYKIRSNYTKTSTCGCGENYINNNSCNFNSIQNNYFNPQQRKNVLRNTPKPKKSVIWY